MVFAVAETERLREKLLDYQSAWMADSTATTRKSQWRCYLRFCSEYDLVPLPATLDTVLLYIVYLADRFKYVSIINYLSALWVLHKINGIPHVDPSSFEIKMTLKGVRRTIGDVSIQARPISLGELRRIFSSLDLECSEDVAYWVALLLGFRGLLRKSNIVEEGLALLVSDVNVNDWGLLAVVRRSKTICFHEREMLIPFTIIRGSIFCVYTYVKLLLGLVSHTGNHQLISYRRRGILVRGTYNWLRGRIKRSCEVLGLSTVTTHSLRRGGSTALMEAKIPLLDIRQMGDWKSMSVLLYLSRSVSSRIELDRQIATKLFS